MAVLSVHAPAALGVPTHVVRERVEGGACLSARRCAKATHSVGLDPQKPIDERWQLVPSVDAQIFQAVVAQELAELVVASGEAEAGRLPAGERRDEPVHALANIEGATGENRELREFRRPIIQQSEAG